MTGEMVMWVHSAPQSVPSPELMLGQRRLPPSQRGLGPLQHPIILPASAAGIT